MSGSWFHWLTQPVLSKPENWGLLDSKCDICKAFCLGFATFTKGLDAAVLIGLAALTGAASLEELCPAVLIGCQTSSRLEFDKSIVRGANKPVGGGAIALYLREITCSCFHGFIDKDLINLVIPDVRSRNHVGKFLRALPIKWRSKVTAIEESKDLLTLPLDELIGNLEVYEVVIEKDSEISKRKKEKYKSLTLKARNVSSDEEVSCSESNDEEYAMAIKEDKKEKEYRWCFKCGDPNHFLSDCPKHSYNDQKAFVVGCWSDSEEDSKKEEICLMALDNNEVLFDTPYHSNLSLDEDIASISKTKTKKLGHVDEETSTVESAMPVTSVRESVVPVPFVRESTVSVPSVRLKVKLEPDEWIKDSGYSRHMTGNKDLFSTYKAIDGGNVVFGSNTKSKIIGIGAKYYLVTPVVKYLKTALP
nr:zf-CCHC domain-containing protein/UBN2 domain-containing protein [Tanacetum cinerariifolium]